MFHNICFGKWWKEQEKARHDAWSEAYVLIPLFLAF